MLLESPPSFTSHQEGNRHMNSADILAKYFKGRVHIDRAVDFLATNPKFMPQFSNEIQIGINALNDTQSEFSRVPEAIAIQDNLRTRGIKLPPFSEILNLRNVYAQTAAGIVNTMMIRGEQGDTSKPFIKWHAAKGDMLPAQSLTAGLLMDVWGIMAACTVSSNDCRSMTSNQVAILKNDSTIGSEVMMPTTEQVMGIKLVDMGRTRSLALDSIQPWLGLRYGFSKEFLKLAQEKFGIILHPRAFELVS